MATASKQQIELYAVIALGIVAAILAYFRFMHKPDPGVSSSGGEATAAPAYEIPALPAWLKGGSPTASVARPEYVPPSRDLFAPVEEAPPPTVVPPREVKPRPQADRVPVLSGTMKGARGAFAIINGSVVGIGDKVGKYVVTDIQRDTAVLQLGDARLVLKSTK